MTYSAVTLEEDLDEPIRSRDALRIRQESPPSHFSFMISDFQKLGPVRTLRLSMGRLLALDHVQGYRSEDLFSAGKFIGMPDAMSWSPRPHAATEQ